MSEIDWPRLPDPSSDEQKRVLLDNQFTVVVERAKAELQRETAHQASVSKINEIQAQRAADLELALEAKNHKISELKEQERIDKEKATELVGTEIAKAVTAWYDTQVTTVTAAYFEVSKGAIDRIQSRATTLQAAAIAIGTLYSGFLAFVYVTADKEDKSKGLEIMPARGILPAFFLGLSIVFAMAYASFLSTPDKRRSIIRPDSFQGDAEWQRGQFIEWATHIPSWRILFVQISVIAMGLAVMALPAAFVEVKDVHAFIAAGVAVVVSGIALVLGWIFAD